jgi:hypothetical protein
MTEPSHPTDRATRFFDFLYGLGGPHKPRHERPTRPQTPPALDPQEQARRDAARDNRIWMYGSMLAVVFGIWMIFAGQNLAALLVGGGGFLYLVHETGRAQGRKEVNEPKP